MAAKQFYDLHHSGKLLVLPNIWDPLGAMLLEDAGYPAVATASASVAFANGYDDGENIPFDSLLNILKKITAGVSVPVTADIESGYADNNDQLKENIQKLVETGIVGINLEDTDNKTNALIPIEVQCQRINLIKQNSSLFINARTDVYMHSKDLDETINRGIAYKAAGADCFYPILLSDTTDIKRTVDALQMPINIILFPGVPELDTLQQIGVARVSLGPSFLKIAIKAMKDLALKLQRHEGLADITGNDVTSDYLRGLVNKK